MRNWILLAVLGCLLATAQARPLFETLDGNQPVRLQSLQLRAEIAGGMAHTVLRMEVHNPNPRMLEATLQLPLEATQLVSGFALDIGGVLRPAVAVDKARGQQVFEAIQRRRVDPALLEHTAGNNFRLRIYPVPAHGKRIVEVSIIEALGQRGGTWRYRPPLHGQAMADQVSIDVRVQGGAAPQLDGIEGGRFEADGDGWRLQHAGTGSLGFDVRAPRGDAPQLLVQEHGGQRYFVAQVPVAAEAGPGRPMPRVLGLLWDSSGSGAKRRHEAELEALGHFLAAAGNIEVRLVRLRDRPEPVRTFRIANGEWAALRRELKNTVYDGATALGGVDAQAGVDAWLLVSDGVHNYGSTRLPSNRPLHVLNSAPGADLERLSGLAARSGGVVADLAAGVSAADAGAMLARGRQALPPMSVPGASDIVADPAGVQDGWLRIAGRVSGHQQSLLLRRGGEDVELALAGRESGFAALLWARYRLHRLGADYEQNGAEINRLGKEFAIPTRHTSLIVLETLEDYIRYDIMPPADLRAAFLQARTQAARTGRDQERSRLDRLAQSFAAKAAWWNRRFSQTPPPAPAPSPSHRAKAPEMAMVQMSPAVQMEAPPKPVLITGSALAKAVPDARAAATPAQALIRLAPWSPNAPYLARLRQAGDGRLYAAYLKEKQQHPDSTAFYLDAAELLLQRGQRMLALRVMSNVAEMELGNRHVLRVLGYRLMQAGEPGLALPLFRKVRELAPEEPQSFRDLGLAYAAAGEPQRAVDMLYEVVKGAWDGRFADVQLIALAELNAIAARHRQLDLRRIDARLLKNLPLDLRVVLTWDADNSDMDLWVTDPNGETCNYGQPATFQGGRMSADFTGGYGPEEFSLRRAKPGIYKVRVNFFGHNQQSVVGAPTLQVTFWSGFGTAAQRQKTIALRLEGRGEHVFVGEFEVK